MAETTILREKITQKLQMLEERSHEIYLHMFQSGQTEESEQFLKETEDNMELMQSILDKLDEALRKLQNFPGGGRG